MGNTKPPKISIGYRVGHLTVQSATKERKNGYTIWNCMCDCGGSVCLDTRTLQRGTVPDCGCITKLKPGCRDITGMRFGKLVAIEPAKEQKSGTVIWHCKCDCGGEVDAPLNQLTAGYRKSCGCLSHPPLKEYVGKRFGRLTVVAYAGKRAGMHRWKCKCDCGNETIVGQTLLQTGKTQSCGCLNREQLEKGMKFVEGTSVRILESVRDKRRTNNTSGYTGVYQDGKRQRWHAQITFKGVKYDLGAYRTRKEAIQARMRGEEMHEDFINWYYNEHKKQ